MSHPTWVRGLKQKYVNKDSIIGNVAPYVGAWIETKRNTYKSFYLESHPTWVRGLKLSLYVANYSKKGRTLRGCVD